MSIHGSFGTAGLMLIGSGHISFAVGANGQVMSIADSLKSECGQDFDEYVLRALEEPFPYSGMMPASRDVDNLWEGRRLRLYSGKNKYREGKVISWMQNNTGPFCRITFWHVNIEMDAVNVGDTVVVVGLESEPQHDGKKGRIFKFLQDEGLYKVKLDNETIIAIKPQNIKPAATTYRVNRMNIDGGGTLFPSNGSRRRLLSLEWLEPALPSIDLDEGVLKANCPTCRAVEPTLAAYDDAPTEKQEECPICMDTKTCRTLQCRHEVCHDCWIKWRNAGGSIPVPPPDIDADELQKERDANFQKLRAFLPHTLGGTGSKPSDSEETILQAHQKFGERVDDILTRLIVEDEENEEEGFSRLWRNLMKCSIHLWCINQTFELLIDALPPPTLEILLRVTEERSDEIYSGFKHMLGDAGPTEGLGKAYAHSLCCLCCNKIGEQYEEGENCRGAIPWYERSVLHARKRMLFDDPENAPTCKKSLGTQLCNLGLAQKRAGFLSAALESYDASVEIFDGGYTAGNRQALLGEMKEWTGSSKKLTPGC